MNALAISNVLALVNGGTGSGNYGHAGRPGERGGSSAGSGELHVTRYVAGSPEKRGGFFVTREGDDNPYKGIYGTNARKVSYIVRDTNPIKGTRQDLRVHFFGKEHADKMAKKWEQSRHSTAARKAVILEDENALSKAARAAGHTTIHFKMPDQRADQIFILHGTHVTAKTPLSNAIEPHTLRKTRDILTITAFNEVLPRKRVNVPANAPKPRKLSLSRSRMSRVLSLINAAPRVVSASGGNDVVKMLQKAKVPVLTDRGSTELQALGGDIHRRAFISAHVNEAKLLSPLRQMLENINQFEEDPSLARLNARRALQSVGYIPPEGKEGTIQDLTSAQRLNLIINTNMATAEGYGRYLNDTSTSFTDQYPAWELDRVAQRHVPREWHERWVAACVAAKDSDALSAFHKTNRMVALKDSDVWQELGDGAGGYESDALGNPFPPFAFNSGMDLIDVDVQEAVALGLMEIGDDVEPEGFTFNEGFELMLDKSDGGLFDMLLELLKPLGVKVNQDGVLTLV